MFLCLCVCVCLVCAFGMCVHACMCVCVCVRACVCVPVPQNPHIHPREGHLGRDSFPHRMKTDTQHPKYVIQLITKTTSIQKPPVTSDHF